jgi:hypothetical protein
VARNGDNALKGGQSSEKADGEVESHGPALSTQMITINMIGSYHGHHRLRSRHFAHRPILACRERLLTIGMAIA